MAPWIWPWLVESTRVWWFFVGQLWMPAALLLVIVLYTQSWLEEA